MAIGNESLYNSIDGEYNTSVGHVALYNNIGGERNVAFGFATLYGNTSGDRNVAFGYRALYNNTNGTCNVALGYEAGGYTNGNNDNETGYDNIFVGNDSRPSADGENNEIVIGDQGRGNGSDTTTIGNSSTIDTYLKGTLNISDIHLTPGSAPGSPTEGDIYMDSTTHKLRCYDGTAWQNCW